MFRKLMAFVIASAAIFSSAVPSVQSAYAVQKITINESGKKGSLPVFSLYDCVASDKFSDTLEIVNSSSQTVKCSLSPSYDRTNDDMQKIDISIDNNGNTIYEGRLAECDSADLGRLAKNSTANINITVSVNKNAEKILQFGGSKISFNLATKKIVKKKKKEKMPIKLVLGLTVGVMTFLAVLIIIALRKISRKK